MKRKKQKTNQKPQLTSCSIDRIDNETSDNYFQRDSNEHTLK